MTFIVPLDQIDAKRLIGRKWMIKTLLDMWKKNFQSDREKWQTSHHRQTQRALLGHKTFPGTGEGDFDLCNTAYVLEYGISSATLHSPILS